jgi:hypothetical protein
MRLDSTLQAAYAPGGNMQPREAKQRQGAWLRELEAALWEGAPRDNAGSSARPPRGTATTPDALPTRWPGSSRKSGASAGAEAAGKPAGDARPVDGWPKHAAPAAPARPDTPATSPATAYVLPQAVPARRHGGGEAALTAAPAAAVAAPLRPAAGEGAAAARSPLLAGGSGAEGAAPARRKVHLTHQEGGVDLWLRDASLSAVQAYLVASALARRMRDLGVAVRSASFNGNPLFGTPYLDAGRPLPAPSTLQPPQAAKE